MRITVERFGFGKDSTLGALSVDGEHVAFTIEDERRKVKVPGETCIPVGSYVAKLRDDSPKFEAAYRKRYPNLHRGMIWLQDVPGFSFVYFHGGNTEEHTDGCILPNRRAVVQADGEFRGEDSQGAYVELYKRVLAALDKGEPVAVEVTEREAA